MERKGEWMKGITHFICGAFFATCITWNMEAALYYRSGIILLGGMFGVLCDTLDFKWARYWENPQYEVDPWTTKLDPWVVTNTLVKAINEAAETGKITKVKLHTLKMSYDWWRQYSVQFIPDKKLVITRIGPLVNTGKVPVPGTEPAPDKSFAAAKFKPEILHTYDKQNTVDIFSGPDFEFIPLKDGRVKVDFIPWHRRWSHSITAAIACFIPGFILAFFFTPLKMFVDREGVLSWAAIDASVLNDSYITSLSSGFVARVAFGMIGGITATGGFLMHILVDHTGKLGSNMFPPWTKERIPGFGWVRSADKFPNFATNWFCVWMGLWNINLNWYPGEKKPLIMPLVSWLIEKGYEMPGWVENVLGTLNYFFFFVVIPLAVVRGIAYIVEKVETKEVYKPPVSDLEAATLEILSEEREEGMGETAS